MEVAASDLSTLIARKLVRFRRLTLTAMNIGNLKRLTLV
jgi:hypothetical protein